MVRRPKATKSKVREPDVDRLVKAVEPLVRELATIHERARALGIFTNERELLTCASCGLMEDVAFEGRLFTHFETDFDRDTGMRFTETDAQDTFTCPSCGGVVVEPREQP